jgi:hypothetical protein
MHASSLYYTQIDQKGNNSEAATTASFKRDRKQPIATIQLDYTRKRHIDKQVRSMVVGAVAV